MKKRKNIIASGGEVKEEESCEIKLNVNLGSHCLFCLQPCRQSFKNSLRKRNTKNIRPLSLLYYFIESESEPSKGRSDGVSKGTKLKSEIPSMCDSCYSIIEKMHDLREKVISIQRLIQNQVVKMKKIVGRTAASGPGAVVKWNRFREALTFGGVPRKEAKMTLRIVRNLHRLIAGKPKVKPIPKPKSKRTARKDDLLSTDICSYSPDVKKEIEATDNSMTPQEVVVKVEPDNSLVDDMGQDDLYMDMDIKMEVGDASPNEVPDDFESAAPEEETGDLSKSPMKVSLPGHESLDECGMDGAGEEDLLPESESLDTFRMDEDEAREYASLPEPESLGKCQMDGAGEEASLPQPESLDACRMDGAGEDKPEMKHKPPLRKTYGKRSVESKFPIYSTLEQTADANHKVAPSFRKRFFLKPSSIPPRSVNPSISKNKLEVQLNDSFFKVTKSQRRRTQQKTSIQKSTDNQVKKCQKCDLCRERIPLRLILRHVQWHVNDSAVKCANDKCPCVFSCKIKMVRHLSESACKKAVNVISIRDSMLRTCAHCGFEATGTTALGIHLKRHERESNTVATIKCPIPGCTEAFILPQSLDFHIYRHNLLPTNKQECSICSKLFKTTEMEAHLSGSHQVTETFKCGYCPFIFDTVEGRIKHLFEHRTENGVACDLCGESATKFPRMESLQQHFHMVHKLGKVPLHICQFCGSEWSTKLGLRAHHLGHHRSEVLPPTTKTTTKFNTKCEICQLEFKGRTPLINHNIKFHDAPPLPCKICGDTFKSTNLLDMHLKNHAGISTRFKCRVDGCLKEFPTRSQLFKHGRHVHTKAVKKDYTCETCGKGYFNEWALKSHQDSVHLGIRHICEHCGKSFSYEGGLKMHRRIHTDERPYVCPSCGVAFRRRDTLRFHIKSHESQGTNVESADNPETTLLSNDFQTLL